MGTDIYLFGKKPPKKEMDKVKEDMEKNPKGVYIRASIWHERENELLRRLFPQHFVANEGIMPYDFVGNKPRNAQDIVLYVEGMMPRYKFFGTPEREKEELRKIAEAHGVAELKRTEPPDTPEFRMEFATAVLDFLISGEKLQKELEKEPEMMVSW